MLVGFTCRQTAKLYRGERCRFPPEIIARSEMLLAVMAAAAELSDLASPPGNRLEALKGNRAGKHSIRINKQWRIVFKWTDDGPDEVEIVDYHK